MNIKEYKIATSRTFAGRKEPLSQEETDKLHCVIGMTTEVGELMDAFKRSIYYGKPLDAVNVGEEIGDIMWYVSNMCRLMDLDLEVLMERNISKLRVRYPEKFSSESALNRDLDAE